MVVLAGIVAEPDLTDTALAVTAEVIASVEAASITLSALAEVVTAIDGDATPAYVAFAEAVALDVNDVDALADFTITASALAEQDALSLAEKCWTLSPCAWLTTEVIEVADAAFLNGSQKRSILPYRLITLEQEPTNQIRR